MVYCSYIIRNFATMIFIDIILGLIVLFVLWIVFAYNSFVRLVNRAKEALSDIDVQLKRRYDLIPNLVNTVKGYATHETSAFENVTKSRTFAMGAQTLDEKGKAENMLTGALKSVFALAEAYPDLKANENFLSLQKELADTEDKIQSARRFYNTNVRDLNIGLESFPGNMIAGMFHFSKMDFFETAEAEKGTVEVKF